jgi:hypothetical protein
VRGSRTVRCRRSAQDARCQVYISIAAGQSDFAGQQSEGEDFDPNPSVDPDEEGERLLLSICGTICDEDVLVAQRLDSHSEYVYFIPPS